MRYRGEKSGYLTCAIITLFGAVAVLLIFLFSDSGLSKTETLRLALFSFAYMLAIAGVLGYFALRSGAYAMIGEDGIHIFSRKQGELVFVPWTDARDCRPISIYKTTALMLIFRYDATFCGKPLATYQGYPRPGEKLIRKYLLDKLMFRLARGKTSAEEVKALPLLFVLTDPDHRKDEYQKYHSMWRAAKDRAAEQEGTR